LLRQNLALDGNRYGSSRHATAANGEANKLIPLAILYDALKPFFALKFTDATKNIAVTRLDGVHCGD
jgi:hypothetical protein